MPNVKYIVDGELYHHGIKGQHWGDRNYQYEDGSLTPAGRLRYYGQAGQNRFRFGDAKKKPKTKEEKEKAKADSAYRVERHKAKMERKTQEALNKERIKKEQSNAKRAAEVAKLKSKVKPSSSSKKEDEENPKNDKKFDKHVKELLNNKKIKDYSKYTKEEIEEAAKRKEATNALEAQKRSGTKIGRLEGYLKSPEGSQLLATTAKSAIEGVSKIAAETAKSAVASYLNQNAKTMYERAVDKAGWERKQQASINKAEFEARKAFAESYSEKGRAAQEWRKAEAEDAKNKRDEQDYKDSEAARLAEYDTRRARAENQKQVDKARTNSEKQAFMTESQKQQLERKQNKRDFDVFNSGFDNISAERKKTALKEEEAKRLPFQRKINRVIKQNALDQVDIQKYALIKNQEVVSQSASFDKFINSLSKDEQKELFAYIYANKK